MLELVQEPQLPRLEADRPAPRTRLSTVPAGFNARHTSPYETYMGMKKSLSHRNRAMQLCELYQELTEVRSPHRLYTAGWAAAEAAMIGTNLPHDVRLALLDCAEAGWKDSAQLAEEQGLTSDPELLTNQYRTHLARANLPLIRGIVNGNITPTDREQAFNDTLNVAIMNAMSYVEMSKAGNYKGVKYCTGLAHEINLVLAINRTRDPNLIALPALARADSGLYGREHAHDVQLLSLNQDKIEAVYPAEVKGTGQLHHFERYESMLVEGKKHLQVSPDASPLVTVGLFLKDQEATATTAEKKGLSKMANNVVHLIQHYKREKKGKRHCDNIDHCTLYPRERTWFRSQQRLGKMALSA